MLNARPKVLVVDDEPHMRRVLEIMLQKAGHSVYAAGNGREALEILRSKPVDLVITDMTMPHMTGTELAREIFAIRSETPLILCTGFSDS